MTESNRKQPNWPLLLPIGLLIVEITVVIVMLALNYTITQYLFFFLLLLALFLVYQIGKQLLMNRRLKKMVNEMVAAKELADSGKPMEAVKEWKKLLLALPREAYLEALNQLEDVYKQMEMPQAVKQVKTIHSESIEFFNATENIQRMSIQDRQNLQTRSNQIRDMIRALPEEEN
jgi:transcriptional regulator of acetoin/glycerol metabolism